ncbi:helix-turn-helix domain-containing protein [Labrys monachus]|uniref:AraC-like DNA-binding protein n=1 Tax=Labrys monachus TaxID=217067 RepID=A0ABU0F6X0_9HYPH|nr:helix-turn-helix domain-containing protein [Labrys monachus]MDQ0390356.1 AraC-like DNA-binding protein [Labrys monachus]
MDIIRIQNTPLTIHDLAEMLGISVRILQAGFRKHAGSPPPHLSRLARLEGAHRDLASGVTPTIADAARKWGFSNAGRFAGEYFKVVGEFPSDTIRRCRG